MLRRTSLSGAALLAGGALLVGAPGAIAKPHKTTKVKVMTRNVFLGADLIPIAGAEKGAPFRHAAGRLVDEVRKGDPNGRMKAIGDEIAKAKPDLVGLQEVSLYRTGRKGSKKPAKHVRWDFLATIMKELHRKGAHYRVVAEKRGFNVEGPTDRGVDIRLTLGDVTLAQKSVKVRHARVGVFRHQLLIPTKQLGNVNPRRSWNSLDATVRGARFHFVNTHLEAYSADFRLQQAKELLRRPMRTKLHQTIVVGDFNSGPAAAAEQPADRPPYEVIAGAGFEPRRTDRFSCCSDVDQKTHWDHNVDWVMARPGAKLVKSRITGREKTKKGVHPSDHGGVVSVLRLKR